MDEQQLDHEQAKELINFQISYNTRKIKATWALGSIIVIFYLLEEYFGGSQNVSVLIRMGANVGDRVKQGEYYRLFTCVFLHAGLLHVFFNTYVLFALGGFFNRILGESRYLTVFLFSGFTGSLASVYIGKSMVSVGASGAIWGLFGSSLALALFRTSLLPETMRLRLRRVTFINLVINLGISFLPMIDMWAHLGGGIGGFAVSLLFIYTPKDKELYRRATYGFRIAATILSIVYATNIVYGMWISKPWINQLESKLTNVELMHIPFTMAVPEGLKEQALATNTSQNAYFSFGTPQIDQIAIEAHFFHESLLEKKQPKDWLKAQRDELLREPSLSAQVKKTVYYRDTVSGGILYYQQLIKNSEIVIHNYVITRDEYVIKLGFIVTEKTSQALVDKLANRVIDSIGEKQ